MLVRSQRNLQKSKRVPGVKSEKIAWSVSTKSPKIQESALGKAPGECLVNLHAISNIQESVQVISTRETDTSKKKKREKKKEEKEACMIKITNKGTPSRCPTHLGAIRSKAMLEKIARRRTPFSVKREGNIVKR